VSRAALEPPRDLKYLFNLRIRFHLATEFRYLFKCLIETDVASTDRRRDELCDPLDLRIRHLEGPADILDGSFRGKRSEPADAADGGAALQVRDVVDDVTAATNTEVHIDVGHRHAPWVEKALEEQVVLKRINVRALEAVGDQRPGRRAAPGTARKRG